MSAAALPIVTAGLGAIGLWNSIQGQNSARSAMNKAMELQKPQALAQQANLQTALDYNPAIEDKMAITGANQNAAQQLTQQLGNLTGQFKSAGGSPTGDTAFNVAAQNSANRVMDPLRMFQAQLASTETQRKIGALQSVYSAPAGAMANTYFQYAGMMNQDPTAALSLFIKGLRGLMPTSAVTSSGGAPYGVNPPNAPNEIGGLPTL